MQRTRLQFIKQSRDTVGGWVWAIWCCQRAGVVCGRQTGSGRLEVDK